MTAPELTIPVDYTTECSDDLILDDAIATDNCGEVSLEVTTETIAPLLAITRLSAHLAPPTRPPYNSSQTITVEDTTAPELTIPADYTSEVLTT